MHCVQDDRVLVRQVPQELEGLGDDSPRIPVIMRREVLHVLKEQVLRSVLLYDLTHNEEQVPSIIIEPFLEPGFGERLAREPATHDIVRWHVGEMFGYIPNGLDLVILLVYASAFFVNITCENTRVPESGQGLVESTYPTKQIYKVHLWHLLL